MSVRHITFVIAILSVLSGTAGGQAERVFDDAAPANWIAPAKVPGDSFTVFHARRTFSLDKAPTRFLVHLSADNRYRLYVNGVQMSSGPQRSDVTHWRYETIDLAPQLHAGRNVIAAVVWNWGAAQPVAQHSHRTGFLVQGDGPVEAALVNTSSAWKVLVDSAYAPIVITSRDMGNYYAAAPGDSIDGARYPWAWETSQYVDDAWSTPAIVGDVRRRAMPPDDYGEVSGWQLEPRSIPPMEEKEQRLASVRRAIGVQTDGAFLRHSSDLVIPARTTASVLLDQSHTTNAYPILETSGGAGSIVRVTYAEALVDAKGQKGNRNDVDGRTIHGVHDVFLPDGGAHRRFATLYWRSFRYIQLDITTRDQPLRVHDFHGVFTAYPFVEHGQFASDLPWLTDMWQMNWNGARIGAFETYMDTPYWEQLQYIGDTRIQSLISLYVAGDDRLMRQAIEHFDESRIPEGLTTSRYPSSLTQIIPPFSLIYVAMVHDYSMLRDDAPFIRARLPGIRGILDWYARHVDSTGMLGAMPYWNYVDWTPRWDRGVPPRADTGHSATISLLYVYALERAAELEQSLGTQGAATDYRARAQAVRAAARAHAWDPTRGLFRDSPDTSSYSQQTNVLAILADAVPTAMQRPVMERVLADSTLTHASYYFSFYVFEALRKSGLGDRYIEQLAPWQGMLKLGLTSAPENPEPTRSDTHAWSAHPNYGLLATVLGVRPSSPGFRTVRITPALGPLRRAEGRVPHPLGDIVVSFARESQNGLRADITLPPGLSGELVWQGAHRLLHEGHQLVQVR
ncbi:MAG: alpha-L-rhamnosidase C-terminal domain-containing protein [Gemmatimonadaceae bacterium]